jgi:hypothetical protein
MNTPVCGFPFKVQINIYSLEPIVTILPQDLQGSALTDVTSKRIGFYV